MSRSLFFGAFVLVCVLVGASLASAQDPNYVFQVGSQGGDAGTSVDILTTLDSSAGTNIQGLSLGVCHDSATLDLTAAVLGSTLATANNGQAPSFATFDLGLNGFSLGCVISLIGAATLPPLAGSELVVASYDILPAAPPGSSPLQICNFGNPPIQISVVVAGASIIATTIDGEVVVGGTIEAFERGDCNSDGSRNIADAIALLGNLFPGANPVIITCDDACDTNDDGSTNIADAVFMLNTLFGSEVLPEPLNCGADPSDNDPLNCDVSGAC